jgi:hypothetical protein
MVKVCVEVREGDGLFRVTVRAESISQAVSFANGSYPDRDVRVVFPIDPESSSPRPQMEPWERR